MIRVGPAGWSYPDWEGRVYPRHKPRGFHALHFLAPFVDCIEINSSFYALPRAQHSSRWAQHVAGQREFRFVAKLLQDFTHGSQAPESAEGSEQCDWESKAADWRAGVEPLVRRGLLAAVLVQFPITFHNGPQEVQRLGRIRGLLEDLPLVLEVRHDSWFTPPALAEISGLGFSLAHLDLPAAWNHPPVRHRPTGPIGYLRLHGRNEGEWFRRSAGRDQRYDYLYSPPEVGELAERARSIASETDATYVITNNHFEGQALANALELRWLLNQRQPVPAPAELVATYPHLESLTVVHEDPGLFD